MTVFIKGMIFNINLNLNLKNMTVFIKGIIFLYKFKF